MLALVGALSLVLPVLAQAGHFALVAHERCSEHGDLVHREHASEGHAGSHETAGATRSPGTRGAWVEDADGHGEHEHCGALACQGPAVALGGPCPDVTVLTSAAEPVAAARASADARGLLLGLAPKTSPPGV